MKIKTILLLGLTALQLAVWPVKAITTSGKITGSETWSETVFLTGDVSVSGAGSLTILPGTTVQCDAGADDQIGGMDNSHIEILVEAGGSLTAVGTEAQPIRFTSAPFPPKSQSRADWYGIRVNSDKVVLKYCTIEWADYGVSIGDLPPSGALPKVEKCIIQDNRSYGVQVTPSGFLLSGSVVRRNGVGIGNSPALPEDYMLEVVDCEVRNNDSWGIGSATDLSCLGCTVTGNGGAMAAGRNCIVDHCAVTGNVQGIGAVGEMHLKASDSTISDNAGSGLVFHTGAVDNCVIERNGQDGIVCYGVSDDLALTVENSAIDNNRGSGINVTLQGPGTRVRIDSNDIRGNGTGIEFSGDSQASQASVTNNLIFDSLNYEIRAAGVFPIIADGNYWGEPSTTELKTQVRNLTKIYDSHDDATVGQVVIRTWLNSPDTQTAPTIVQQPGSQKVIEGNQVTFTVVANGSTPLSYQWFKDGLSLANQTEASLVISKTALTDQGSYSVRISNGAGNVTSNPAVLEVTPLGTPQAGGWKSLASASIPRRNVAAAEVNGILYAAGGAPPNSTGSTDAFEAFDPGSNTWTTKPHMPVATQEAVASSINGVLYVVGGGTCCVALETVQAYDPAQNSWSVKTSMPYPAYNPGVTALNGKLYVAGGGSGHGIIYSTLAVYDPATDSWSTKAPMLTARAGLGLVAINGVLYAIGGGNLDGSLATVEAYDPASNTWIARAPMPILVPYFTVAAANNLIYVIADSGLVQVYDPATDSWRADISVARPLDQTKAVTIGQNMYLIGNIPPGYPESSPLAVDALGLTPPQCVSAPSGLMAWWAAEGNAADLTGAHSGTTTGSVGFAPGVVGQSFEFSSSGQFILTRDPNGGDGEFPTVHDNFTIEFWAYPTAERESTQEGTDAIRGIGGQRYAVFPSHGGDLDRAGVGVSVGINGITVFEHASFYLPSPLVYDAPIIGWHHIALVYRQKQPNLYLDGQLVRTGLASQKGYVFPGQDLGDETSSYGPYLGKLDEVSIYNRSLSAAEITAIYAAGSAGKCQPSSGPWELLGSGSIPRRNAADAVVNGILYAAGGALPNSTDSSAALEAYDPSENIWSTKASMPMATQGAAAVGLGNLLYVVGGGNCCSGSDALQVYDPAKNGWSVKASLPYAAYYPGAAVVNDTIYVTGGTSGHGIIYNTLAAYNPATDTWSTKAPMPTPRAGLGLVAVNGILYAIGGGSGVSYSTVEAYDPASNTWTTKTPMPILATYFTASAANGLIYVIADSGEVQVYSPATDSWGTEGTMPVRMDALRSAAWGETIYVTGNRPPGYPDSSPLMLEAFTAPPLTMSLNLYAGLTLSGQIGQRVQIDYKTDLNAASWTTLTTLALPSAQYLFVDTTATAKTKRFYRAILLP